MLDQSSNTEPEYAQSSSFTALLRDSVLCGLVAIDRAHHICALNPEAGLILGLEGSEAAGQPFQVLPSDVAALIGECFETGEPISDRDLEIVPAKGTACSVQGSCFPCRGPSREATGVIALLTKVSSSPELGLNLQRLDRLASIGTLSASMAHEIKNALVAVNTFVEDLIERNKDAELTPLVSRELHRIDAIVSQMLKFAGPGRPTFSPASVHGILDQCLRLLQPQLESKHIRLRRTLLAHPDFVAGDDYQLQQAFLNILLNAVAAMSAQGELTVNTARRDIFKNGLTPRKMIEITIRDTGAGIPPENLPRLFEPFFSTKPQGTGLGLAITRRIILEHHGEITVDSQINQGSTFRITLPSFERAP